LSLVLKGCDSNKVLTHGYLPALALALSEPWPRNFFSFQLGQANVSRKSDCEQDEDPILQYLWNIPKLLVTIDWSNALGLAEVVMLRIDTGRKHQIRTHRNHRGCSFPTVFQAFTFRYKFMYRRQCSHDVV